MASHKESAGRGGSATLVAGSGNTSGSKAQTDRGDHGGNGDHGDHAAPTPVALADAVAAIFTRFDGDASGSLTSAELLAVLDPKGTHAEVATKVAALIAQVDTDANGSLGNAEVSTAVAALDTNGDGMLSPADHVAGAADNEPAELVAALLGGKGFGDGGHGHGGPRDGLGASHSVTVADAVSTVFTLYDADKSGTIALSELLAVLDPKGSNTHEAVEVATLFAKLDTDANGSLAQAELTAAFAALDSNGDGTLNASDAIAAHGHDSVLELIGVPHQSTDGGALLA